MLICIHLPLYFVTASKAKRLSVLWFPALWYLYFLLMALSIAIIGLMYFRLSALCAVVITVLQHGSRMCFDFSVSFNCQPRQMQFGNWITPWMCLLLSQPLCLVEQKGNLQSSKHQESVASPRSVSKRRAPSFRNGYEVAHMR